MSGHVSRGSAGEYQADEWARGRLPATRAISRPPSALEWQGGLKGPTPGLAPGMSDEQVLVSISRPEGDSARFPSRYWLSE